MPNVTIFMAAENMPADDVLADLTTGCTDLCTNILEAALENVHIVYVAVRRGRGHPIYTEVKYRLEPARTPAVMERFMSELDVLISRETGLTTRIRCFGYAPANIQARN